jgi:phosphatidylserine/phosphatidylglycerophosphate/cardiolipin synthase-like enzyme
LTSPVVAKQLIRTALRFKEQGIDPANIEIVLTGYNDHSTTSTAVTADLLYALQQAGIRVLLWKPHGGQKVYRSKALHHAKAFTVDGKVAYIGSANAMVRSLVQDWEIGVMTDSPAAVRHIDKNLFDRDLAQCVPFVPPVAWKRKVGAGINTLLGPILRLQ